MLPGQGNAGPQATPDVRHSGMRRPGRQTVLLTLVALLGAGCVASGGFEPSPAALASASLNSPSASRSVASSVPPASSSPRASAIPPNCPTSAPEIDDVSWGWIWNGIAGLDGRTWGTTVPIAFHNLNGTTFRAPARLDEPERPIDVAVGGQPGWIDGDDDESQIIAATIVAYPADSTGSVDRPLGQPLASGPTTGRVAFVYPPEGGWFLIAMDGLWANACGRLEARATFLVDVVPKAVADRCPSDDASLGALLRGLDRRLRLNGAETTFLTAAFSARYSTWGGDDQFPAFAGYDPAAAPAEGTAGGRGTIATWDGVTLTSGWAFAYRREDLDPEWGPYPNTRGERIGLELTTIDAGLVVGYPADPGSYVLELFPRWQTDCLKGDGVAYLNLVVR